MKFYLTVVEILGPIQIIVPCLMFCSSAPSSNDYKPGFDISLMIKDLNVAKELFLDRSKECKNILEMTKSAYVSAQKFINEDKVDFSAIIRYLDSNSSL